MINKYMKHVKNKKNAKTDKLIKILTSKMFRFTLKKHVGNQIYEDFNLESF